MSTIALSKKIDFAKGDNANDCRIIIEPLFPGYGITLGNSLRRVLLSSLPGAAIIGVKIKGVEHEFSTLPHLKEDILEFILNLKQIRLKIFSEEVVKLELSIHGQKEVKAGDIKKSNLAEIVNPDLVLGHITEMAGNIEAEIFVKQGMGYEMIENRENKSNEIGYIEMDSVYSPISQVGIDVTNVRVGKMTNWDKLILHIVTDGTILPEGAFKYAVNILLEQFTDLISEKIPAKEEDKELLVEPEVAKVEIVEAVTDDKKTEAIELREEKPRKRGRPRKTE